MISSKCDVTLKDNQNMTSADIADSYGHTDFAREIRKLEMLVSVDEIAGKHRRIELPDYADE